ncbi:MAG: thioredoxin domain-containing protein [Phycisphaerales bacterium]|nr:MAG: thioredoxin domain-containing protein [Phycisphaerales bacterium]
MGKRKQLQFVCLAVLLAGGSYVFLRKGVTMVRQAEHSKVAQADAMTAVSEAATQVHTNRLIHESSPYLLQHAHNPVDWYPWGPEALERARREDKPIFLSIGYSTCHWCHVMETESFEDEATAAILNEYFIAIKVDREERPDIDETYMKAVQMMTGSGGWPLSVFLTPEGRPFYGGTYFPPQSMYGRPSFQQVLQATADAWRDAREQLLGSAAKIEAALEKVAQANATGAPSRDAIERAVAELAAAFDATDGGFGDAPKFPQPTALMFLLNAWHRSADETILAMVTGTLDAMAAGGIHDHLGGGFHRYSTDAQWLVPHFEKMLYDQSLLAQVYLQAWQATGDEAYATVARAIFDYVLRDMTDAGGGFHAAEDADSEGREGAFYVWDPAEIQTVLGEAPAGLFTAAYGVTRRGNFEEGKSILHIPRTPADLVEAFGQSAPEIEAKLAQARRCLLEHRNARPRPHRDDKVITGWNGLMISALAYGGAVLDQERYVSAAESAAAFVLDQLRDEGRLRRYFRAGRAVENAFLPDYAFMIRGLIDLYEASLDARWLQEATDLAGQMTESFSDGQRGGFFLADHDAERLIVQNKPGYDGAVPSGNSVAALALLRLGRMTENAQFSALGQSVLEAYAATMDKAPTALTAMLLALDFQLGPTREIVIAGSETPNEAEELLSEVRHHFLPNTVLIFHPFGAAGQAIEVLSPFTARLGPVQGQAAAYVCQDYVCRQPVTTPADLRQILRGISAKD